MRGAVSDSTPRPPQKNHAPGRDLQHQISPLNTERESPFQPGKTHPSISLVYLFTFLTFGLKLLAALHPWTSNQPELVLLQTGAWDSASIAPCTDSFLPCAKSIPGVQFLWRLSLGENASLASSRITKGRSEQACQQPALERQGDLEAE